MIFEPETLYRTVEVLATWWVQALALILIGLGTARLVRPASQSMVYRFVVVTVLLCPIFSQVLSSLGMPKIRLPIRPAESSSSSDSLIAGQSRDSKLEVDSGFGSSLEATRDQVVPVAEAFESRVSNTTIQTQASPIAARREALEDPSEPSQSPSMGFSPIAEQPVISTIPFLISLLVVWACGTIVMLTKFALELRSSRLLIRQSSPAESVAAIECGRAANQLGIARVPMVLINPFLSSPCLIGHWQAVVLLPEDVSGDCYHQVFLHELAHLRRGDWLWNAIGQIANSILWPQPLLLWMYRQSQLVAEEVCDDYVIEHGCSREGYLQQLLEIAERSLPQPFASSVSMVGFRSKLGKRAARILDTQRRLSTRVGRLVASLAFMIAFAVTTAVALVGFGRSEPANQNEAVKESEAETTTGSITNFQKALDENVPTSNENRPDNAPLTCSGKVLDFNGNPVAGVTVLALNHRFDRSNNSYRITKILTKVESASDGSYSITFKPEDGENSVRAEKSGFGPDQLLLRQNKSEHQFQLARLKPISGRVIDTEGNPVAGVKVKVIQLVLPVSKKSVDDWIASEKPELLSASNRIMMSNDPRVTDTAFPGLAFLDQLLEGGKTVETNAQRSVHDQRYRRRLIDTH
ncbi:MAG: M56 family metallopeptidase [Pirellulales bacterium]